MKFCLFITALFLSFVAVPMSLCAQEKEVTLEEVVVTGTRDVQDIRKIPANITVITREEIEKSNAQTVIDLTRSEVGVVARDFYGTGKTASVDIRGFGETGPLNTLVLVDGRRVNEIDLSGVDWTQIPLNQIERIEVVRGAGSVLYGDNAVGGVINIITRRPEKHFSGRTEVQAGSYHLNREGGSVSGTWGPLSGLLSAGYNATEGYRENGFFRGKDVGGRLIYELDENTSFNFAGSFHKDKTGLPGGLTQADIRNLGRRATLTPDNEASTEDGYGAIGMKVNLRDWGRIETDLSYRHREVENFLDFPASFYTYQDERYLTTWGFTPKYILEKSLGNHLNKVTLGLDFYRSTSVVDSDSIFFGFPSSNRSEIKKRSTGLYLLDEFAILDHLILSPGYRHEWVTYEIFQRTPRARDETSDRESAWSLSLDYLFGKRSSAFFSAKRSFRFPVSDELILVFPNFKVNPEINPQTGYHYEAGIRHSLIEEVEANLTLFWADLHDEIFFNPTTFTNENYPKTRRQGLELGIKARPLEWASLWANYTYLRPRLREGNFSGSDIPGVPRHKGAMGMDLSAWKGFQLSGRANFIGARYLISDFANQVDKLNRYTTVDAKISYRWKGLQAFVGVNNLFNRKYSEWAVTNAAGTTRLFYPSTGRNYLCGASYTF
ncbi:MAG: TonB-dependent receptor [Thermodesulfobacteriota bacterium]